MPETAVNLYGFLACDKDYIWLAWEIRTMNPVSRKTKHPEKPAHSKLRCGILAADAPHVIAAAYTHARPSYSKV
jgi:hypothetical protein